MDNRIELLEAPQSETHDGPVQGTRMARRSRRDVAVYRTPYDHIDGGYALIPGRRFATVKIDARHREALSHEELA